MKVYQFRPLEKLAWLVFFVGSQREVARRLGVSESAISRWLQGHRSVSKPIARLIEIELDKETKKT